MKREILIATTAAALLLTGCFNSETGASQRAANEAAAGGATKHEAKHEAKVEKAEAKVEHTAPAPQKVAQEKPAAPAPAAESTPAPAAAAAVNTAACAGCHGANFEKKAMGVSKVVSDMTKDEIKTALHGYKDGSYGGGMKALMKGQVAGLDDAAIEAIANKFGK